LLPRTNTAAIARARQPRQKGPRSQWGREKGRRQTERHHTWQSVDNLLKTGRRFKTASPDCKDKATCEIRGQTRSAGPTRGQKPRPTLWYPVVTRNAALCRRVTTQSGVSDTGGCLPNRAKRPHSITLVRESSQPVLLRDRLRPLAVVNSVGELAARLVRSA
jgi:hypothetical protein